ncbi:MAG: sugar ABC transporter substrate-binding protein [Clostridiaceae bacterium]|nr:sugar ABC transporter substrate-binding protein [Clostridiaceae bacterium]
MKRKVLVLLLCLSLAVTMLAGCSSQPGSVTATPTTAPSDGGSQTPEDKITLKWALWDYDSTPYWGALIEEYKKVKPNVTIEYTDLGSTDYMTVLAAELSGSGSEFDVVTIKDVPGYATLVQKNTLEPLEPYIQAAGIDLSLFGGITDQVTVDGKLYELPFRSDFWVIFYNKDVFDRAGVDYPTNDMTFEEYDELARKVTDTTFGSEVYGAHYHTWRSAVQLFGILDGKHSILDSDYSFFEPYYNMVLNQMKDGVAMPYTDVSTEGLHYSAAFANGNIAMLNMGSWFIATLISSLEKGDYDPELCGNWGIVKYPHAEGVEPGSTLGTITGLSITAVSDHKQEAFEFIKWVSGPEGAAVMARTGNFPAISTEEVKSIIAGLNGFPKDEQSKEALEVSNLYLEVPYAPNVSEINAILDTYHKMIMSGEISVEEGIAAMNEEVAKLKK